MPFEEVQIGGQHTQEMVIAEIHDEFLRCRMAAFEGTEAGASKCGARISFRPTSAMREELAEFAAENFTASTTPPNVEEAVWIMTNRGDAYWKATPKGGKLVDVSKPNELRKMDMPDGYTWVDSNTRKDADENVESLQIPYKTGETIHVTKGLVEPMDTSSSADGLQTNTTVDIFVDENRQGRSWGSPSGGSGLPSGYSGKCIVLCENGTEISGQVLFKSGCEGAALSTGTETYEAAVAGNPDLSGNLSGNTVTGTPITVYLHVGSGTNNPISGNWDFYSDAFGNSAWTGNLTGDLLNNNWVAVKIPTGTEVDVLNANGYTYVIPINRGMLSGIGTNTFAPGPINGVYSVLIAPTTGFAAFVNYSVHIDTENSPVEQTTVRVASYVYRL